MKIKLKANNVINGAVWFEGSILRVPEDLSADAAKEMIAADKAEVVKDAPSVSKPAAKEALPKE